MQPISTHIVEHAFILGSVGLIHLVLYVVVKPKYHDNLLALKQLESHFESPLDLQLESHFDSQLES